MKKIIEKILFNTRWILIPFNLILMLGLFRYLLIDVKEIYDFLITFDISEDDGSLVILRLVDMAMIVALVEAIITGNYNSTIAKDHGYEGKNITSGFLKIKLSTSIIGVASIHLLGTFIKIGAIDNNVLYRELAIFCCLILASISLSITDYLHIKSETLHEAKKELEKHG